MSVFKAIAAGISTIVAILALSWMVMGNDFFLYQYFAPKREAVRRQVFEQTKSYNEGMVQELQNMQFDYVKADESHKVALADIILHRAANYDLDDSRVPTSLRDFVQNLRRERSLSR
ncbi:MAG: hypothetical protein Q7S43_04740 [bacterium]|nr:hypothetical protein [bacterium]